MIDRSIRLWLRTIHWFPFDRKCIMSFELLNKCEVRLWIHSSYLSDNKGIYYTVFYSADFAVSPASINTNSCSGWSTWNNTIKGEHGFYNESTSNSTTSLRACHRGHHTRLVHFQRGCRPREITRSHASRRVCRPPFN